jgi:hypothetical protein
LCTNATAWSAVFCCAANRVVPEITDADQRFTYATTTDGAAYAT